MSVISRPLLNLKARPTLPDLSISISGDGNSGKALSTNHKPTILVALLQINLTVFTSRFHSQSLLWFPSTKETFGSYLRLEKERLNDDQGFILGTEVRMRGLLGAVQGAQSVAMSSLILQEMSRRSINETRRGVESKLSILSD